MTDYAATTANICALPIRPQVFVRMRVRRAMRQSMVCYFQEIEPPRYKRAVRNAARKYKRGFTGLDSEVPMAYRTDLLTLISGGAERVHGGLDHVSPSRYANVSKFMHVTGQKVAYIDCHTVSKPRKGVDHAAWRMKMWYTEYIPWLRKRIAELHAEGFDVIVGGDMNNNHVPLLHADQVLIASSGLDHLWVIPAAGRKVVNHSKQVIKRTRLMDHPIVTGRTRVA